MEDFLDERCHRFQGKGWNSTGAGLLAVSCWIANKNKIQTRRKFSDLDIILGIILLILAYIFITNTTILLVLVSLSASYIAKMLITTINLEDLIESLSRDSQKILVFQLLDFCELKNHQSISDLCKSLLEEQTCFKILLILSTFVSKDTKYYIL